MITLQPVKQTHIDFVWSDAKDKLAEACEDECTIDQLKTCLLRGERTLVRLAREEVTVGWGVFRVDQFPNFRASHITNLWARHAHFDEFFESFKQMSRDLGCSRVRCSAKPAQQRIYQHKCGFEAVYTTLEVKL